MSTKLVHLICLFFTIIQFKFCIVKNKKIFDFIQRYDKIR